MKYFFIFSFFHFFILTSCIEPIELLPDIEGEITAFEVVGQVGVAAINSATRTVSIELSEGSDFASVAITRLELTDTAVASVEVGDVVDLSSPFTIEVTTVASYTWTVNASVAHSSERELPGGGFDEWHVSGSRTWNPWPQDGVWEVDRWWDTGNRGVSLLAPSNSAPTEFGEGCPAYPEGRAARLESVWAGIKVAGGNIYFGQFGRFTGIDATCLMGHPWQARPRSLKGWYRYFPQPVDEVGGDEYLAHHPYQLSRDEWMGSADSLSVIVALWASPDGTNKPFTVDTTPSSYVDFLPTTPGIIAYGQIVSADEQAEWAEFEVPLEYRGEGTLPANAQLLVQITSSKNCNYFIAGTGDRGRTGPGSLMYVDELELTY